MRVLILFFSSVIFLFGWVGKIVALKNDVFVKRNGELIKATVGFKLEKNDVIISKDNSKAQIIFKDETVITIGKNSSFKINEFEFENKQKPKAKFSFFRGAFREITGKIGKIAPHRFKIKTPNSSIGIRGTQIVAAISEIEKIACLEGKIVVITALGSVEVPAGEITEVLPKQPPLPPKPYKPQEIKHLLKEAGGEKLEKPIQKILIQHKKIEPKKVMNTTLNLKGTPGSSSASSLSSGGNIGTSTANVATVTGKLANVVSSKPLELPSALVAVPAVEETPKADIEEKEVVAVEPENVKEVVTEVKSLNSDEKKESKEEVSSSSQESSISEAENSSSSTSSNNEEATTPSSSSETETNSESSNPTPEAGSSSSTSSNNEEATTPSSSSEAETNSESSNPTPSNNEGTSSSTTSQYSENDLKPPTLPPMQNVPSFLFPPTLGTENSTTYISELTPPAPPETAIRKTYIYDPFLSWGVWYRGDVVDADSIETFFVMGEETSANVIQDLIDKKASYDYNGEVHGVLENTYESSFINNGAFNFHIDFGDTNPVKGDINFDANNKHWDLKVDYSTIEYNDIRSGLLTGDNSEVTIQKGSLEGKFYGDDASRIGGNFNAVSNDGKVQGIFVGKKK